MLETENHVSSIKILEIGVRKMVYSVKYHRTGINT